MNLINIPIIFLQHDNIPQSNLESTLGFLLDIFRRDQNNSTLWDGERNHSGAILATSKHLSSFLTFSVNL